MYLSFNKLKKAGYEVLPSKSGVQISAINPLRLDFSVMGDQLEALSPLARESALEAFYEVAELAQVLEALK